MKIENILLTTDFSENARKAYHRACSLAQKFGATIHLVHFAGMVPVTCGGAPSDDFYANTEQELEQEATTHPLLRQQRVSPALIQGRWTPNDLHGLEAERDIDIVVMATHGRTGLKHFVLGSFAERMVRNSMSPMLVCHERQVNDDFHPIRVLVPYDFSPPSSAVLPAIRFLAQNYGCSFHFVHIDEPLPARSRTLSVAVREMLVDAPLPSPQERFERLLESELSGISASWESYCGIACVEITRQARERECDLVLMGTHGVLGSVAQYVTRKSPCDVLSIRQAMVS